MVGSLNHVKSGASASTDMPFASKLQNEPISHQCHENSLAWMLIEVPESAHVVKVDLSLAAQI